MQLTIHRIRVVESEGELETAQINYSRSEADNTNAGKQFTEMIRLLRASAFVRMNCFDLIRHWHLSRRLNKIALQALQSLPRDSFSIACKAAIWSLTLCVLCKKPLVKVSNYQDDGDILQHRIVDIRADMRSWVEATRSKLQFDCPEVVLRNLDRGLDDAEAHHDIFLAEAQFNNYLRPESANRKTMQPYLHRVLYWFYSSCWW